MSEMWGISPTNRVVQKPLFAMISQLNGKFDGLYLWTEIQYRQSDECVGNQKGSRTSSQNDMNFGPQTAENWTELLPTLYT